MVSYALLKTAADAHGDRQLARELEGQVPRLLEEGTNREGRRYLVMSATQGTGETRAFTPGHERFLASLGKARFRSTDFEVSGCCEQLNQSLRELDGCVSAKTLATLRGAYHDCETALLYWTGPYVLSQGDFAPWIQRALHGRLVTQKFLQSAMKRAHDFARLAYPEWTWRPRVIGALTLVYLLGALLHHALPARRLERSDPVVKSYWNLIEKRSAWMPSNN